MQPEPQGRVFGHAFTRVDLLAVLTAVGLLVCLALPGLANQRSRFDRVTCLNHLRMIGLALKAWGDDHGGRTPWRTPVSEGGTMGHALAYWGWWQFYWISNQLGSPKVLICPADWAKSKNMATNWGIGPGGFGNTANRANSLSYLVGLEASVALPTALLSGDRNLSYSGKGTCSAGIPNAWFVSTRPRTGAVPSWTNSIHESSGNVLLNNGSVLQTTHAGLREAFSNSDDNGSSHVLTQ
jgi:competence protein ComGC